MAGTLVKLACVLVMFMVVSEAAMTCKQIENKMVPCVAYLTKGGSPSAGCCFNLRNIVNSAKTTPDRQNACTCLQGAAAKLQGIKQNNAAKLPSSCGVNIPFKISMSTNCKSVK